VIFFSLLAFPLLYWLNFRDEMNNSLYVFGSGILFAFIGISILTSFLLPKNSDTFFYVFSVFAFTALVDLDIAMTLDNVGLAWINFYLKHGEPYLYSSYGSAINWWDGTFHYALYIYVTWAMATGRSFRWAGFVWVGSIMNSLIVFLPGNVVGKFGNNLKESYFLNVPYVLFPLIFAVRQFRKPSPAATTRKTNESRGFFLGVLDCLLIVSLLLSTLVAFFRAFVAIDSPIGRWYVQGVEPIISCEGKWPKLQLFAYVYYFVPFYLSAINSLINPDGKTWFPDWTCVAFGAALQGQFSYIFPAIHQIPTHPSTYPKGKWIPIPAEGENIFWVINFGLYVVVPALLFFRVCFVDQSYWAERDQVGNGKYLKVQ